MCAVYKTKARYCNARNKLLNKQTDMIENDNIIII